MWKRNADTLWALWMWSNYEQWQVQSFCCHRWTQQGQTDTCTNSTHTDRTIKPICVYYCWNSIKLILLKKTKQNKNTICKSSKCLETKSLAAKLSLVHRPDMNQDDSLSVPEMLALKRKWCLNVFPLKLCRSVLVVSREFSALRSHEVRSLTVFAFKFCVNFRALKGHTDICYVLEI